MCCSEVACKPSRPQSSDSPPSTWAIIKEAASMVKAEDVWKGVKEFLYALKLSFRAARGVSEYDLEAEDRFLLTLFQTLVIEKMYSPEAAGMQVPIHFLEQAKRQGIEDFAYKLKNLPREPFLIERLGFFPLIFSCNCSLITFATYFSILNSGPDIKVLLWLSGGSFVFTTAQLMCKIYRLIYRLIDVYQRWAENLLAQQAKARGGRMNRGMGMGMGMG